MKATDLREVVRSYNKDHGTNYSLVHNIGRPKGTGSLEYMLDSKKDEILGYLKQGVSKASIAKILGCHPQTLYNHIARNID